MSKILLLSLALMFFAAPAVVAQSEAPKDSVPATFPGGPEAWRSYLESNLQYPKKAVRNGIQGIVRIQFIVAKDGKVSDVTALTTLGGGLEEEAIRLIANGPDWIPASINGQQVRFRHVQAFTFKLQ